MMILFRLFAGGFSVLPVRLFRPVGFLLCGGFFLSAGAYAKITIIRENGIEYFYDSEKQTLSWFEPTELIPAGTFTMGSNDGNSDEKPVHEVYLDAFRIDTYEVTVADYKTCVDAGECKIPRTEYGADNWGKAGREKHPVNGVDWNDATAYCQFAGKRLPTEAEWEKAASWKDGKKYKYPSGKNTVSCTDAVMDNGGEGCGKDRTWEVGSKPKEINGTYDMAGNVWEWVSDWYGEDYYSKSPKNNPKGPNSGKYRVRRGGGWVSTRRSTNLRGAYRYYDTPENRYSNLGFRCVGFGP